MKNQNTKIIKAKASFVHNSPRKIRIVADAVRDMNVVEAVNYLKLLPQRAARPLLLVYEQALGNAKSNFQVSPGELIVKSLQVNDGPRGAKKADVHAHGARFDRGVRRKRLSHILLELMQSTPKSNSILKTKSISTQPTNPETIPTEAITKPEEKVKKSTAKQKKEAN